MDWEGFQYFTSSALSPVFLDFVLVELIPIRCEGVSFLIVLVGSRTNTGAGRPCHIPPLTALREVLSTTKPQTVSL